MSQSSPARKQSNLFGLIALVIAAFTLVVPLFLLSRLLIPGAILAMIGLAKDGNKIFSGAAIVLGLLVFYTKYQHDLGGDELDNQRYKVTYEVDCKDCTVRFINASGDTKVESGVYGRWTKSVQANGNTFVNVTAQPNGNDPNASVRLYVNGTYMDGEHSSGNYVAASASCQPRDYDNK
jgi:hypothetical protein